MAHPQKVHGHPNLPPTDWLTPKTVARAERASPTNPVKLLATESVFTETQSLKGLGGGGGKGGDGEGGGEG